MSSSVSQGSHHSPSSPRIVAKSKSTSPRASAQQHQHEAQSSRMPSSPDKKGKRPRTPSPERVLSPARSSPHNQQPKSTVKLFGKVIQEGTPSRSPSPKRQQTSGNSPTLRLFGKDISPPASGTSQHHKSSGGASLFGVDLHKEAAKGKQNLQLGMSTSTSPTKGHNGGSPSRVHGTSSIKSPVIHLDSDSEGGKSGSAGGSRPVRRSESPFPARQRGDTPESQKTDASFSYSEDSGFGAKSALSRRMPTQMKGQFTTKPQRHAKSARG
ncbi:uncharacterized protein FA14DRAFT_184788 [Meira miltonrushii]|uniref:Uncharacterized protein n=1 Tax=Meira miltonrushii TaxID=1280837 RepID=A0A316VEH7_9BASI|nr:uncharacterized protein FA14DRAFT_184788 [Meira miltonrushii]PWN35920.1 hypothetical protein FA14DRAFT_184788 [Meira miltonrushii]